MLSPIVLGVLVVVCVGALGLAFVPSLAGSGRAEKRMKAMQGDMRVHRQVADLQRTRDSRRRTVQDALKAQNAALSARRKKLTLKNRIFQAGFKLSVQTWVRNCVIFGVALFAILAVMQIPLLFAGIFALAGAYVLPNIFLANRRKAYQNAYLDELPNAIEAIVRGVKSGLPLNDSIRLVSREVKEPVRSEFLRILDQQSVGKTMQEAVEVLFDRVPLPEVNFFVVVIAVQQQSGGNLSEALGNLAALLRNRKKMKSKVKALSSEAKASAVIIGSLPLFVAGAVSVLSPSYLLPLVSTTPGHIALAGAVVMVCLGAFIMNRMIQFEY